MRGKRQHETRDAAMKHRRSLVTAGKANPDTLRAYMCTVCGFWHVGNRRAQRDGRDG
jgi:rubrerythrin